MFKINVLTKCENEEEFSVIISSVLTMLEENKNENFIVRKLKRTTITSPSWNVATREEY